MVIGRNPTFGKTSRLSTVFFDHMGICRYGLFNRVTLFGSYDHMAP